MPLKDGDISPLRKVMSFATERYVTQMRDLLLQYGAFENDADRERWILRKQADVAEQILKNNYKNIDKGYNPWSATETDFWDGQIKNSMRACNIASSSYDSLQGNHKSREAMFDNEL